MLNTSSKAQSYNDQRAQVLAVHLLGNGVIGGVGGAINRPEGEKFFSAFFRNFIRGSVGGLIKYTAKYNVYYLVLPQIAFYSPINRLHYFLGHSMTLNASLDRKILETYYCNFLGADMRFSAKREKKLNVRLSLATLCNAGFFALKGERLNIYKTLEYGILFFEVPPGRWPPSARAGFNCLSFDVFPGQGVNLSVLPHELVHSYQMYDFFGISSFYEKKARTYYQNNSLYNKLSRFLVPDYEVLFFTAAYLVQPKPRYFNNYFEFEAQHFQTRVFLEKK